MPSDETMQPTTGSDGRSEIARLRRNDLLSGAAVGAAAALIASAVNLGVARSEEGVHIAQLLSERLTELVPLPVFRTGLERLESSAKPLTLAGLIIVQVILGGLVGASYARIQRNGGHSWPVGGLTLAVLSWAALSFIVAPLAGLGLFGHVAPDGVVEVQRTFVIIAAVFALVTALFIPWLSLKASLPNPSRRRFLGVIAAVGLTLPVLVSAGYLSRFVRSLQRDPKPSTIGERDDQGSSFRFPGMPSEVTPNDEFYIVSKNFIDPDVDETTWTLEIGGMVNQSLTVSYGDLLSRPSTEVVSTLECISNPVGGEYISTAVWGGVPLRSLLDEAGLQPGVIDIELRAADEYVESITRAEALADDVLLVHTMNGEPLPVLHGFPLRLIVPGIFGMKNIKWITNINAVGEDIKGYWQQRDWADDAPVLTMSRIATPREGQRIPSDTPRNIGGVAFAGDRGILKVEVSLDDGHTWQQADLSEPVSPLTWLLWKQHFEPREPGPITVLVRATDGTGQLQTREERETLPSGATGWHRVTFEVSSPSS